MNSCIHILTNTGARYSSTESTSCIIQPSVGQEISTLQGFPFLFLDGSVRPLGLPEPIPRCFWHSEHSRNRAHPARTLLIKGTYSKIKYTPTVPEIPFVRGRVECRLSVEFALPGKHGHRGDVTQTTDSHQDSVTQPDCCLTKTPKAQSVLCYSSVFNLLIFPSDKSL